VRRTAVIAMLAAVTFALVTAVTLAACNGDKNEKMGIEQAYAKHEKELRDIVGSATIAIYSGQGNDRIEIQVDKGEKTAALEAAVPDEIEGYPVVIVEQEPYKPPPIDIQGTIKKITPSDVSGQEQGAAGSILVVADETSGSTYDKASITITSDTTIWRPMGEGKDFITFADLREGDYVIVDLTGPVAESYPVQATAADIEVMPKI